MLTIIIAFTAIPSLFAFLGYAVTNDVPINWQYWLGFCIGVGGVVGTFIGLAFALDQIE